MATSSQNQDRVKEATPPSINQQIERETWVRIAGYANKTSEEISARIDELEKEWDIERYLGVNMSTLALSGLVPPPYQKINIGTFSRQLFYRSSFSILFRTGVYRFRYCGVLKLEQGKRLRGPGRVRNEVCGSLTTGSHQSIIVSDLSHHYSDDSV